MNNNLNDEKQSNISKNMHQQEPTQNPIQGTIMQQQEPTQNPVQNNTNIKNKNKSINIGLILGICLGVILIIVGIVLSLKKVSIPKLDKNNSFYAEGYSLNYDSNWSITSITNAGESVNALVYKDKEAYLAPVGISSLSNFENQYNIKFTDEDGKNKIYKEFYDYWNNDENKLFNGSSGFNLLTDDVYYATMDYGESQYSLKGKMYLIVDVENNAIISMMSNISKDFEKNSQRILDILKTIVITTKYDDELTNSLNSMSKWNTYSNVRQGNLATKKDINGGWKILSNTDAYFVFKNNEFWWYKSQKDLNDNYWYGKIKVYSGKSGLKNIGLQEEKVDYIIANAGGTVTENNIYSIIFTPKKVIISGEDKSSTNIAGEDWHMVWIIVDHGQDGLEAQVLNVKTAATSYYVKVKD